MLFRMDKAAMRIQSAVQILRRVFMVTAAGALVICAVYMILSYARRVSGQISDGVVRLHVIPNSNSPEDQDRKLKVRDAVLAYLAEQTRDKVTDSDGMLAYIEGNLQGIREVAEKTLSDNGSEHSVEVRSGTFDFPTRNYTGFALPAGSYRALRVEIGEAEGSNWWCILFPPLCFNGPATVKEDRTDLQLKEAVGQEGYRVISSGAGPEASENISYKFKFRILEILGGIHNRLSARINITGKK
ncbi:MAG TPA: stage II sporulation protein R [Clostridiales bacterium]|nr:stage II sporulation protein R [Clostridiales bacterium]